MSNNMFINENMQAKEEGQKYMDKLLG